MSDFSHINEKNQAHMVDVGAKKVSQRMAVAESIVVLGEEIMSHLEEGEIQVKKGPVFHTAILAGIMAAKQTSQLIPLCHPLPLNKINIEINVRDSKSVQVLCKVKVDGKTGVEMEALTGASVSALTIYDMCKAFSHDISIEHTRLLEKKGGKNDFKR